MTGQTRKGPRSSPLRGAGFIRISTASAVGGLGLLGLLVACQRKAPGPEECHALAVRWVEAVRSGGTVVLGRRRTRLPVEDDMVLEQTTACLTTPYDRELVACVQARGAIQQCFRAFENRRGALLPAPE